MTSQWLDIYTYKHTSAFFVCTVMSDANVQEFYPGRAGKHNNIDPALSRVFFGPRLSFSIVLVTYLKELDPHLWSYTDFLNKNRVTVVNASSHSDKWYTLDSTWTRRFLQEAVGLELMSTGDIKKMVIMFWYSWRKGASCQVST